MVLDPLREVGRRFPAIPAFDQRTQLAFAERSGADPQDRPAAFHTAPPRPGAFEQVDLCTRPDFETQRPVEQRKAGAGDQAGTLRQPFPHRAPSLQDPVGVFAQHLPGPVQAETPGRTDLDSSLRR